MFFFQISFFFFSSRRRHTRFDCDWSSDVCSSDLFSAHDLRTLPALSVAKRRFRVILFLAFLLRQFFSRRPATLPSDHSLRSWLSSLHGLPKFNESAASQPLQPGRVGAQPCRWTQRQRSFLFLQSREKRCLFGSESRRQFT